MTLETTPTEEEAAKPSPGEAEHKKCSSALDEVLRKLDEHGECLREHSDQLMSQGEAISSIGVSLKLIQSAQAQQNQIAASLHTMAAQMQKVLANLNCQPGGGCPTPIRRKTPSGSVIPQEHAALGVAAAKKIGGD